jgi:recombination protein RecA
MICVLSAFCPLLSTLKRSFMSKRSAIQEGSEEAIEDKPVSGRDDALRAALASIEKQFGKGSIMSMGESAKLKVDVVPTGSFSLDLALGVGGLPRGRVIEIYGPESSGKTTLALSAVAEAQKLGGNAAFIDAEHAFDPEYAGKLGVDLNNLLISQPDTGEQALEITETLVRSNALDIIVIDSVAALVPRAEIEGEMGEAMMGVQARLMSQALRKLTGAVSKSKTILVFINQIRMKIGVMFGNPETTTGGNALKFYSSVRLDIRRKAALKRGEDDIGNHVAVKVVKNKVAPPFKTAEFDILFNEGIDRTGELVDLGIRHGVIERAGSWVSYKGEKLGQGKDSARVFLANNPEVITQLREEILNAVHQGGKDEEPTA